MVSEPTAAIESVSTECELTQDAASDNLIEPKVILAIDPGTSKCGYAIVSDGGEPVRQGIVFLDHWENELSKLVDPANVHTVVLGDGTNRLNIEAGLTRLLPQAEIVCIDEKESTVDAWRMKRREEAGANPFRVFLFTLKQMFRPVPVDDFAARVLAERYLQGRGRDPAE